MFLAYIAIEISPPLAFIFLKIDKNKGGNDIGN